MITQDEVELLMGSVADVVKSYVEKAVLSIKASFDLQLRDAMVKITEPSFEQVKTAFGLELAEALSKFVISTPHPAPVKEVVYVDRDIDPAIREMMLTNGLRKELQCGPYAPHPIHVTVEQPNITIRNEVQPTPVHIQPADVHVAAPQVKVEPHIVVNNDVQPTPVTVEAPRITVMPSEVVIENKAPDVHVAVPAPKVSVTNKVEPITHVKVDAPTVNVEAPNVSVHNDIPEYEVLEQEHKRDVKGQLTKTITTKRRRN